MTTLNALDVITKWVQTNICDKLKFKVPDDKVMDAGYQYQTATPTAFSMFIPAKDRMTPPAPPQFPCCCVQILLGEDQPARSSRKLDIRLNFATWSPGDHGRDYFMPREDGSYTQSDAKTFTKNENGWREAWTFLDTALAKLESTDTIDGIRIMQEEGIKYGPFVDEQKAVANFWPYWCTWAEFSVDLGLDRHNTQHDDLL